MAVSVDFLQSMMQRLIEKIEIITTQVDADRRNTRSMIDNLTFEMGRKIGALDAKVEIGLSDLEEQLNRIESKFDERLDRIETKFDERLDRIESKIDNLKG